MLKIWGRRNSVNVQKVLWTVAELGLDYDHVDIGSNPADLDAPSYVSLNPNRLIPTLEDDATVIWESNACVRYLAAQYGSGALWPEDPRTRALADMWMDWMLTTLGANLRVVFIGLIRTPAEKRDEAAIQAGAEGLGQSFSLLDQHLAKQPYVVGEHFSLGDIPVGAACYRFFELPIARPELPHLSAWYARLKQRPAYQAHVMLPLT